MHTGDKKGTLSRFFNKEGVAGYIFVSPFVLGFLTLTFLPILASLLLAFTQYNPLSSPSFIGLANFKEALFEDEIFWQTLGVTFFYAFVSVPIRLIAALLVAMLFVRPTRLSGIYRAVYYLPSILGGSVAVAVLWKRLFASDGTVNMLLQAVGIPCDIAWLARTDTAIWTLILLAAWQFGSSMLVFLSGLKQIPTTLYEAATIDGANAFARFFRVTLPMLTPVIFFNLVMQLISGFIAFTQSFLITGGKPLNSTLFYAVYVYQQSFGYQRMGYGCALAWIMLVIVGLMTALVFKTSDKWVYYESK